MPGTKRANHRKRANRCKRPPVPGTRNAVPTASVASIVSSSGDGLPSCGTTSSSSSTARPTATSLLDTPVIPLEEYLVPCRALAGLALLDDDVSASPEACFIVTAAKMAVVLHDGTLPCLRVPLTTASYLKPCQSLASLSPSVIETDFFVPATSCQFMTLPDQRCFLEALWDACWAARAIVMASGNREHHVSEGDGEVDIKEREHTM